MFFHSSNLARTIIVSTSLSFTLMAGCSYIEPLPGSNTILLSNHNESCALVETVNLNVMEEMALIERSEETMKEELLILAKNKAIELSANAVWPISELENGSQSYEIYRCSNR